MYMLDFVFHLALILFHTSVIPSVSGLDVLEPDDPALRVMQDHLMEERLIKLKVYENMPLLG